LEKTRSVFGALSGAFFGAFFGPFCLSQDRPPRINRSEINGRKWRLAEITQKSALFLAFFGEIRLFPEGQSLVGDLAYFWSLKPQLLEANRPTPLDDLQNSEISSDIGAFLTFRP